MRAYPVPFTGTGLLENDSAATAGLSFKGFTSVAVHNGPDANAPLAIFCPGPGVYDWDHELDMDHGIYLVCEGVGSGSVWFA